jgi:3-oxoacyl-ACP reductase-like protein
MGIFDTIKAAIFGSEAQAAPAPTAGAVAASGTAPAGAPAAAPKTPVAAVDVAANLDALAKASKEKFDWRKSIVDLMKLLKLDSSLNARKELAKELGYTGNTNDSATMNVWLHKQVMTKLAENGGKVPDELK